MQEIFEEVFQYLRGVWLKRRYILIVTWLMCPLGWLYVSTLPNVYGSSAKIFADTRSILKPLLRGMAIQTDPRQELALIVKTITTRDNLEKIARAADADLTTSTKSEYEALLDTIKGGLSIKPLPRENIYTLSFQGKEPALAQKLVEGAISVFIENTLGEKRIDADQAQRFLDEQIIEYERRLSEDERRLADFKKKYAAYMVNNQGSYYNALESAKKQLESSELALKETETELNSARGQLKGENDSLAENLDSVQTKFDDRIEVLQLKLDEISVRFTDKHPEVAETRRRLEELLKQKENYLTGKVGSGNMTDNPYFRDLKATVSQLENRVASLKVRRDKYQAEVDDLQSRLDEVPDVQAKLTGLNRTYSITKNKYHDLLNRKESAEMSEKIDQSSESISFRVLEPAKLSLVPSGPPRVLYLSGVLVFSIAVGVAISLGMSLLNPVVTNPRQLSKIADIPVFGLVSATEVSGLQKWEKRKAYIFIAANSILLALFAAFLVINAKPDWHELVFINGLGAL